MRITESILLSVNIVLVNREEKVKAIVDDILDKIPDQFNMVEIMLKVEERTPYVIVAFQECERMNNLMKEMKRSLRELDLGLKGELTISSDMEDLSNSLFFDQVSSEKLLALYEFSLCRSPPPGPSWPTPPCTASLPGTPTFC